MTSPAHEPGSEPVAPPTPSVEPPADRGFSGNMLRTRLVLGLLTLLAILLATGLYAIMSSSELGKGIDALLSDNYESVHAMQRVKLACARLSTAVVKKMAWDDADAKKTYLSNCKILTESLAVQESHAFTPGEILLTQKLHKQIQAYLKESPRFFALPAKQKIIPQEYFSELSPAIVAIAVTADEITDLQQASMTVKKLALKDKAEETRRVLLLAMITAIIVSLYASYRLGRGILQPIESLTASIRKVGEGHLDQEVPVLSTDELGQLAKSFNRMAAQLKIYRENTSEHILRLNRTMQTIFSSFPDPIFVIRKDGTQEIQNPAASNLAARLLAEGQRLPEVIETHILDVVKTEKDYLPDKLQDAMAIRVDGEERFYLLRVLLLRDEKEQAHGTAVVLDDVTNQRLIDDLKSNLIATVSHELKTPLTSVRMALHLLLEEDTGPLTKQQSELLEVAKDDSERLLRTLNNLLDLARMEDSQPQLNLDACAPSEIIERSIRSTVHLAVSHGLNLTSEVESFPEQVEVDRLQIDHVFTNFLTNAIKYSPPGGKILVRSKRMGIKTVRISVIDQGPGIAEEHQPLVFDKFYRVPGQSRNGAGLGLSIAREIVVSHGGKIGVISTPPRGSEFYVDLPLVGEWAPRPWPQRSSPKAV